MPKSHEINVQLAGLKQRHAEIAGSIKLLREGQAFEHPSIAARPQHLEFLNFEAALIGSRVKALEGGSKTRAL